MRNRKILGERFWFDWLVLKHGLLRTDHYGLSVKSSWSAEKLAIVKKQLKDDYAVVLQSHGLAAIQVVSNHQDQEGFFLSHWFNIKGILLLLKEIFPGKEFGIKYTIFPKGMLFAIERRGCNPEGIVTILNNVLGNILPEEQIPTLTRVRTIL